MGSIMIQKQVLFFVLCSLLSMSSELILYTLYHLWFAGVRECLPWCSIVDATVTVHQFFCILHYIEKKNINCLYLARLQTRICVRQKALFTHQRPNNEIFVKFILAFH